MNRDNKGRFSKTRNFVLWLVVLTVLSGVAYIYGTYALKQATTYVAPIVDNMQMIRNREDIKKQQELIVEKAFLMEEKAKVTAQLKDIESKLEVVRKSELSFQ